MTVFFIDGSKITFNYPRQAGSGDQASILANIKKAIDSERLVLEVDGDLVVIPVRGIKYVRVSPAPPALPAGVFRQVTAG
jgi:hypothetical protein